MTSQFTSAHCPRASPSPQREHLPVLFTQHDQRHSEAASDMILFDSSDIELDDRLSLAASDVEELLGSVTDPALLPPSASRNARLRTDERHLPPLDESVVTHLCPPKAIGWTRRLDKPLQRFTRWLCSRSSRPGCSPVRTQTSQGATAQTYSNSPPLKEPAVGVGVIPAARSSPVADPLETGPPLSSERNDMARVMGPACVAAQREPFGLPERILNTMATRLLDASTL